MNNISDKLIHLNRCRGISRRLIRRLLNHDPSLTKIYLLTPPQIAELLHIPLKNANNCYKDLHDDSLLKMIEQDKKRFTIVTLVDEHYPLMLKTIKDAPIVLYALGDLSIVKHNPSLSVIGTRNPSNEALPKMKQIVRPLIQEDWLIISGMAKGIDSFAHKLTLMEKGKTVAVLGGGFHHIYPKENVGLFKQIADRGLLLSEYPPDIPPKPYHFPERNRIISGLTLGTLVIEATSKSGTLITVDQALDQGKEVYAVPGSPLIPQTTGCHQLIQDGAKLVTKANDILEDWTS